LKNYIEGRGTFKLEQSLALLEWRVKGFHLQGAEEFSSFSTRLFSDFL